MNERSVVCPRCGKEARNSLGRFCTSCGLMLPVNATYDPPPAIARGLKSKPEARPPKARRSIGGFFFVLVLAAMCAIAFVRHSMRPRGFPPPPRTVQTQAMAETVPAADLPGYSESSNADDRSAEKPMSFGAPEASIRQDNETGQRSLRVSGTLFGANDESILVAAYISKTYSSTKLSYMVPIGGARFEPCGPGGRRTFELNCPLLPEVYPQPDPSRVTIVVYNEDRQVLKRHTLPVKAQKLSEKSRF